MKFLMLQEAEHMSFLVQDLISLELSQLPINQLKPFVGIVTQICASCQSSSCKRLIKEKSSLLLTSLWLFLL